MTWHQQHDVAIKVEETRTGREVSLYERQDGHWERQYTMVAGQARIYSNLFKEIFPEQ